MTGELDLPSDYRGASILISIKGRFLWAIGDEKVWRVFRGRQYISYGAIGGKVEPGESFREAAVREFKEETGCSVKIVPASKTFVFDEVEGTLKTVSSRDKNQPLLVWRKKRKGGKTLTVHTYLGSMRGKPKPCQEVPALLYTPPSEIFRRRTPTLGKMLAEGSELVEQVEIPHSVLIRPWGTPCYLRKLLTDGYLDHNSIV